MTQEPDPIASPEMSPEIVASELNVGSIPEPPHKSRGGAHEPVSLSPEQRIEIARMYLDTDVSMPEIARAYGLSPSYPYYVLKVLGITWRRGDTAPKPSLGEPHVNGVVKPEIVDSVPEPVEKALENMLKWPTMPPKPEPVRAIAPTVRDPEPSLPAYVDKVLPAMEVTSDDPNEGIWQVDYLGSMLVKATSIDQALERARVDGHVRNIVGITQRRR